MKRAYLGQAAILVVASAIIMSLLMISASATPFTAKLNYIGTSGANYVYQIQETGTGTGDTINKIRVYYWTGSAWSEYTTIPGDINKVSTTDWRWTVPQDKIKANHIKIEIYDNEGKPATLDSTWYIDKDNPTKPSTTLPSGVTTASIGGVQLSIDRVGLLAPYIGLASIIAVATVAAAICTKRVRRAKEKQ